MKSYTITVNGNVYDVTVEENKGAGHTPAKRQNAEIKNESVSAKPAGSAEAAKGSIKVTAPMPGKVLSINANAGDTVKRGETILIFEAMKMENSVVAPEDGTVAGIDVAVGDSFEAGAVLATLN